jgi:hypothetical protein
MLRIGLCKDPQNPQTRTDPAGFLVIFASWILVFFCGVGRVAGVQIFFMRIPTPPRTNPLYYKKKKI